MGLSVAACAAPRPPSPSPSPLALPLMPSPAPSVTPDAPFRAHAPAPDGKVTFVAPMIRETRLKNGLRVLFVERHELPIVSARLVVGIGAGDVPSAPPGLLSFLGAMLEQGTRKRDALEISDAYEALGAQHGAWVDWDSGGLSARFLSERLDAGLELFADVATDPQFPEAEVERVRARRIGMIQQEQSSPQQLAQNAVAASIFGRAHPYGHHIMGDEADVKRVTRAELLRIHQRMFVPESAALILVGDVSPSAITPRLEATFGAWRGAAAPLVRRSPKTPPAPQGHLVLVDKPGPQSQVQLVRPGVAYAVKDREAVLVANAILGGMFTSRVNLNLREKNHFAYSARSSFAIRHGAGPFSVGASVHAEKTGAAIRELKSELDAMKNDGPTGGELALAKESLRLALPGRFESTAEVGNAVADLVVYDLPLDDYEGRPARIDAVTAADVKRVASEYFDVAHLTIVVVGGKAEVLPQLAELKLGAPEERDFFGNPIAGAARAP